MSVCVSLHTILVDATHCGQVEEARPVTFVSNAWAAPGVHMKYSNLYVGTVDCLLHIKSAVETARLAHSAHHIAYLGGLLAVNIYIVELSVRIKLSVSLFLMLYCIWGSNNCKGY